MALVLPSTVEEINKMQNFNETVATQICDKSQDFEYITVEKKFKREFSLPNGVENWNIGNFDSYLNFDDNNIKCEVDDFVTLSCANDRLVPEESYQRGRCESISSVSSMVDDKRFVLQNCGVKTFSTVCMDSGSTCISSDHTYVATSSPLLKGLDPEETYQNLDTFLHQVPDISLTNSDTLSSSISSVSSPASSDAYDITLLHNSFADAGCSLKRPMETGIEDDVFCMKQSKTSNSTPHVEGRYTEIRRKNNIASKNCRKTRKEKQKEMEQREAELRKENDGLKIELQVLEELVQAHKDRLFAILQKR